MQLAEDFSSKATAVKLMRGCCLSIRARAGSSSGTVATLKEKSIMTEDLDMELNVRSLTDNLSKNLTRKTNSL